MSFFASLAIVIQATTAAAGQSALATGVPHPAVVRVAAPEADGVAYGSGTLVGTTGQHGLVVTNWHVVRDAKGRIEVIFPDGFRSAATILATDADWDLAALAIWRPAVEPVRLAEFAPRPGDALTIAGYGSGRYRATTGRCTQYVAPGSNLPFEMVELSVAARQGDSGGPILNHRGELAGVLFGAARGTTTGSYCGRVRWFLARVTDEFRQAPESPGMLAAQPPTPQPSTPQPQAPWQPILAQWPTEEPRGHKGWEPPRVEPAAQPPRTRPVTASISAPVASQGEALEQTLATDDSNGGWTASTSHAEAGLEAAETPDAGFEGSHASTRLDQIKTVLAVIGGLAVLFHGLKLLGVAKSV